MKRHYYSFAVLASLGLFVLSTTWLLAPHINHLLIKGPNLVSEYEAVGMPYAGWFRFFDCMAAILLLLITYIRRQAISKKFHRYMPTVLFTIGGLQIVDVITPVTCIVQRGICQPNITTIAIIHGIESFITAGLTIGIAMYIAKQDRRQLWLPVGIVLCSIIGFIVHSHIGGILFALQTTTLVLTVYTLWYVTLHDIFESRSISTKDAQITARLIAVTVGASGVVGLVDSVLHITQHVKIPGLPFTESTAWLSQHTVLVSLVMLYMARALWQGSQNAWRLMTWLTFIEIIRYAAFGHSYARLLVYILLFVLLLVSQQAFTIKQSFGGFSSRLLRSVAIVAITFGAVVIVAFTFSNILHKQWDESAFTPTRVLERTLLLEVRGDPTDPLKARLLAQTLTTVGIVMYASLFLSIFAPSIVRYMPGEGKETMRILLKKHSLSSEDYFKLWPQDKHYWFNATRTASVAYKQKGSYLIALANPITAPARLQNAIESFHHFARSHGAKVAWLMIDEQYIEQYKTVSYTVVPIGASAVVGVQQFSDVTVTNKWWRWKRNKAIKSGLTYQQLVPPHSTQVLEQLRIVSDAWLSSGGHEERSFALGYFDEHELKNQLVHVLYNHDQQIVAFANQLPSERALPVTTIDLMRFIPDVPEAMAFLLSELILSLKTTDYTYFDLGFVPLAHTVTATYKKTVISAIRRILTPVFSSKGLEQFKNKFDPQWHNNYIAYDGDYIDAVKVINSLNGALKQ